MVSITTQPNDSSLAGVLRCSRYAFGPNRLHYCGPDASQEIYQYIEDGFSDPGLASLLGAFKTMYPYLRHIAHANNIRDPFDERVVDAYWVGNELLDNIEKKTFHRHLIEDHHIPQRIGKKSFTLVEDKILKGAVPHHSFHALDIWKRTGHLEREHTVESMDSCRISWGTIVSIDGPTLTVETEPLLYQNGKLKLGAPTRKKIARSLEATYDVEQVKLGEIITMHWSVPCEVISGEQAARLKRYTLRHIRLANLTI